MTNSVTPCFAYDDEEFHELSYTPPIAFNQKGSACSDDSPSWIYSIDATPIDSGLSHIKLSVDSINNRIWLKGLRGGALLGTFKLKVTAHLQQTIDAYSEFYFEFSFNPCAGITLISPKILDQLYYVTNPASSYDPPIFTSGPSCAVEPYTYRHKITPAQSFMTPNGGTGKLLQWQTNDEINVAQYTVTIKATSAC